MSEAKQVFSIQFRPLLYKLCLVLGFPEPKFKESDAAGGPARVSVVVKDGSKEFCFEGESGNCFGSNAEIAARQMVMHLVTEYGVCVDDVSLQLYPGYLRVSKMFGLKRRQLGSIQEDVSYLPCSYQLFGKGEGVVEPALSIDFFKLLTRIVSKLGIAMTPVEYLQFRDGTFMAWMSVECQGVLPGCQWFESKLCSSAFGARECLSKTVICALMPVYHYQVFDVNYRSLKTLIIKTELERESFLTAKERAFEVQPESVVFLPTDLEKPSTPRNSVALVRPVFAPARLPRKCPRVVAEIQNANATVAKFIPDSVAFPQPEGAESSGTGADVELA